MLIFNGNERETKRYFELWEKSCYIVTDMISEEI